MSLLISHQTKTQHILNRNEKLEWSTPEDKKASQVLNNKEKSQQLEKETHTQDRSFSSLLSVQEQIGKCSV